MCSAVAAQRRPERQPRLHAAPGVREVTPHPPLNEGRSVNPGYTRPRPLPHRLPSALNEGRSVNPGYTRQVARRRTRSSTLNEGRSVNPGYTPSHLHCRRRRRARSTKAGASTPATPDRWPAGERAHPRSTKAGASTPATPRVIFTAAVVGARAQRRPERQPRLHAAVSLETEPVVTERSTKAGASTPATLLNSAKGQYRDKPSLVHGCGSLDNDAFASILRDFGRYPVRMVRIKQSRLP